MADLAPPDNKQFSPKFNTRYAVTQRTVDSHSNGPRRNENFRITEKLLCPFKKILLIPYIAYTLFIFYKNGTFSPQAFVFLKI